MKDIGYKQLNVFCPDCGEKETYDPQKYCCDCGGAWEIEESYAFDVKLIDTNDATLWRYSGILDLGITSPTVKLGAGWTPLLPVDLFGRQIHIKPEYYGPTGSFKDRGVSVMINSLVKQGVTHIVEDSSGNAGAAVAAYAARGGIKADIFVPAYASPAKLAQIKVYGANVRPIEGPRVNAKLAALGAVKNENKVLASHAYHPVYLLGQQTAGWEVWEQLGGKAPDWIVVPVGQGGLLLGFWLAFKRLYAAGLVKNVPRMVAAQPELLAPLCRAYDQGLETVPALEQVAKSIAEGLAITEPVRGRRLLQAIRQSGGTCVKVSENAIKEAQIKLAQQGVYIEPTSAAAVAAAERVAQLAGEDDVIVVPLTGSGLKGEPKLDN